MLNDPGLSDFIGQSVSQSGGQAGRQSVGRSVGRAVGQAGNQSGRQAGTPMQNRPSKAEISGATKPFSWQICTGINVLSSYGTSTLTIT